MRVAHSLPHGVDDFLGLARLFQQILGFILKAVHGHFQKLIHPGRNVVKIVRKNYLKGSYAVEVCVKMDYKNALSFIDFQKTSKYNPHIFPRTGNHRVLYKQFFKMPAEKYFYDDILYDILNKNKNKA